MTHFSSSEFVDLIEGTLAADRACHVESCSDCGARAHAMAAAMRRASEAEVPEPSPLFWDRFADRVRHTIAEEPAPASGWFGRGLRSWLRVGWVAVAMLVLIVASRNRLDWFHAASPGVVDVRPGAAPIASPASVEPAIDEGGDDAAWTVLRAAASDMEFEEASDAGLSLRPAAIDRAVLELTPAERSELGRLLQNELKRAGA